MTDPMELVGRLERRIGADLEGECHLNEDEARQIAACIREMVEAKDRVMVPRTPTEDMLMAARGLIMSLSFGVPNYQTSLSDVARSGYYGEHWAHILSDDERAMTGPITKAHRADLIWRAMVAAALPPAPGAEDE